MNRVIVHVDMDAFFASVEQHDAPDLRGKPVIVGADPAKGHGRGVVCAASYEARQFGIHSAMPISKAYRICPGAVFIRPRFYRYAEVSGGVMDILRGFSPIVEQISIDEAFLDCTGTENIFGPPQKIAEKIKQAIYSSTGLTASVGIASNKSVAKIASDLHKPNGCTICPAGHEKEFLAVLPIRRLWGVGKKTVQILEAMGIRTIGDMASIHPDVIERRLGKSGIHLWILANGIDDRPVGEEYERKSYSEETTFSEDIGDDAVIDRVLFEIADRLSRKIRRDECRAKTITLKIRLQGFETHTRSRTLTAPVNDVYSIRAAASEQYRTFDRQGKKVRLIGIAVSNLAGSEADTVSQLDLFAHGTNTTNTNGVPGAKNKDTEKLLDELKNRYGDKITRAAFLPGTHRDPS